MTSTSTSTRAEAPPSASPTRRRVPTLELLVLLLAAAVVLRPALAEVLDRDGLQMWSTIFVSITFQALPFLVLGVLVAGAVAALVPPAWIARLLPADSRWTVPKAGVAGAVFPGCECGSVPVAGRLTGRGAPPAAAFAFMLAAPAINPIVLVATAVAFPGQPEMVAARFGASLVASVAAGMLWARLGSDAVLQRVRARLVPGGSRIGSFVATARHDLLHAGGWLVLGGAAAATLQTVVPRSVMDTVASNPALAVTAMAALAILLALCSEADAFVASSFTQFSPTSQLVFLVVGPAVDVKLVAMHVGVFGRAFAVRFAPMALAAALVSALLFGWLLL